MTNDSSTNSYDVIRNNIIPDGKYVFKRKKRIENRMIIATAVVNNDKWLLLKGSQLAIVENKGLPQKGKEIRKNLKIDTNGILLNDVELGKCTPSFAGSIVLNQSNNGWRDWYTEDGQNIDIYRKK